MAARLLALSRISSKNGIIALAGWFIILLFIALECSPIFVKILSQKGPYDDRLKIHEYTSHTVRTRQLALMGHDLQKNTEHLDKARREWIDSEMQQELS